MLKSQQFEFFIDKSREEENCVEVVVVGLNN